MYRVFLPFLIFGCYLPIYADSTTQTDWSGGDGILGPVLTWANQFFLSECIEWSGFPGVITLPESQKIVIGSDFLGASSIHADDIDNDGDIDVISGAGLAQEVAWWENENGYGASWTKHTVADTLPNVREVFTEDIDSDGHSDILVAVTVPLHMVIWYENTDGSGTNWNQHTVGELFEAKCVYAADIDEDDDLDVLGCSGSTGNGEVIWWENENGLGTIWTEHLIDPAFEHAISVYADDINADGYIDVIAAGWSTGNITWWENVSGAGTSWVEHVVVDDFIGANCAQSGDVDGDGDLDILGVAIFRPITWWENADGLGTVWIEHVVDSSFEFGSDIDVNDIDLDGDTDVLAASSAADVINWWENADGLGTSWIKHNVVTEFHYTLSTFSTDIDNDGAVDILGASFEDDELAWWDLTPIGCLESSILDTQDEPDWDYLEWSSEIPDGTSVSFQVRASDDHTAMGAWSDTLSIPCLLDGILTEGDQYVQYRVILETSDPVSTPTLFDVMLTWDPMEIEGGEYPAVLALLPFSPNPSITPVVRFVLPEPASVDVSIFNLSGRLVDEIHGDGYSSGFHDVLLEELSPGIYFCRMTSGDFTATQCFVVIE